MNTKDGSDTEPTPAPKPKPKPRLDLENMFTYHSPTAEQAERYIAIRNAGLRFAQLVVEMTPESAERTLAIRDIQRAVMMANAAIALNEEGG